MGLYDLPIVFSQKEEKKEVVIQLNVIDKVMPKSKDYHQIFECELWQYPYRIAEYFNVEPFSQEHFLYLKKDLLFYKELGGDITTCSICEDPWGGQTYGNSEIRYPSMIKWIKEENNFSFDYQDFDKWVSWMDSQGMARKIRLFSISPWHEGFYFR
ncbi:glycoside hydrolase domain-containing protein [Enterococcus italicus]|uniref:glycoside hydrolase domain-containing protein n=1 Tax=Enterococcus italicus TaxID=246144 RepID=UPI003F44E850